MATPTFLKSLFFLNHKDGTLTSLKGAWGAQLACALVFCCSVTDGSESCVKPLVLLTQSLWSESWARSTGSSSAQVSRQVFAASSHPEAPLPEGCWQNSVLRWLVAVGSWRSFLGPCHPSAGELERRVPYITSAKRFTAAPGFVFDWTGWRCGYTGGHRLRLSCHIQSKAHLSHLHLQVHSPEVTGLHSLSLPFETFLFIFIYENIWKKCTFWNSNHSN